MTKGQTAMIAVEGGLLSTKETPSPTGGRPSKGITATAKAVGVNVATIAKALFVKEHAPDLVEEVINSTLSLDEAHSKAEQLKEDSDARAESLAKERAWREDAMGELRKAAPDLANAVADGEFNVAAARKILEQREREERGQRTDIQLGEDFPEVPEGRTAIGKAIEAELGQRQGQRTDIQLPENLPEVPKAAPATWPPRPPGSALLRNEQSAAWLAEDIGCSTL